MTYLSGYKLDWMVYELTQIALYIRPTILSDNLKMHKILLFKYSLFTLCHFIPSKLTIVDAHTIS